MASGTFQGTTSNEYITPYITWQSTSNTAGNYSIVKAVLYYRKSTSSSSSTYGTWKGTLTINGVTKNVSLTLTIPNTNAKAIAITSDEIKVAHDTNGAKSIQISATGSISGTTLSSTTISKTVTLDTIARASSITYTGNVTLGGKCDIRWTPASSSFAYKVKLACGGTTHESSYITPGSTSQYTYAATMSVSYWDQALSSQSSGTCTATLYTYTSSSGTLIGSDTATFTISLPNSVLPSVNSFTTSIVGGFDGYYIQGKSQCSLSATFAAGSGSSITSCSISGPGISKSGTGTSLSGTTSVLNKSGTLTYTAKVTDARGSTAETTKTITVYEYSNPKISKFTVTRAEDSTEAELVVSASCTQIGSSNRIKNIKVYQKLSTSSAYEQILSMATSGTSITWDYTVDDLDTASSYDFKVAVTDTVGGTNELESSVASAFRIVNLDKTHKGVAIGKMSEDSTFDCALPARFRDGIEFSNKPHGIFGSLELDQNASGNNILYIRNGDYTDGGDRVSLAIHRMAVYIAGENSDGLIALGAGDRKWKHVCAATGTIVTSDRAVKTDISEMSDEQEQLFNKLQPVTFKFTNGTSGRTHYGFVSQDVEDALAELELTGTDFAGFCKDLKVDENGKPILDENGNEIYTYSLRYSEFIALNTYMIQKLQAENNELRAELQEIKEMIANRQ